jgi:arginine:ornithine antiporter/lysine permease
LKLAWTGETYAGMERSCRTDCVRGAIATLYAASMIVAGGSKFLLLSALLYAPGTILFVMARRERQMPIFTLREGVIFGCITAAALIGLYGLVSGSVSI